MPEHPPAGSRPLARTLVVALVAAQGAGLVGLALFFMVELVVASPLSVIRALMAALLTLLGGAGLLLVARGLGRGRRWARAPALVTQHQAKPVAVGLVQGGRWYVGVPLVVWSLAVLVLLFTPAVADRLED